MLYNIDNLIDKKSKDCNIYELRKNKLIYSAPDQNLVGLNKSRKKHYTINEIFTDENINLMKRNYIFKKLSKDFSLDDINVCIHIRRGDITKYGANCGRFTQLSFFVEIIKKIK